MTGDCKASTALLDVQIYRYYMRALAAIIGDSYK